MPSSPWDPINNLPPGTGGLPVINDWQPPDPSEGCPFDHALPGWRIFVQVFHQKIFPDTRTFGTDTFGSGKFGGDPNPGQWQWSDITDAVTEIDWTTGAQTMAVQVPVDRCTVTLNDSLIEKFIPTTPADPTSYRVGDVIRLSFMDETDTWFPVSTCRLEAIRDVHDSNEESWRRVELEGAGMMWDLVVNVTRFKRIQETAGSRLNRWLQKARWTWSEVGAVPYPTPDPILERIDYTDVEARAGLDLTALSAGWQMSTDPVGQIRFREWPPDTSAMPALYVADCETHTSVTDDFVTAPAASHAISITADTEQLVNVVTLTDVPFEDEQDLWAVGSVNAASEGVYGPKTQGAGFPLPAIEASQTDAQALADRYVSALGGIVNRVTEFEAHDGLDPRWTRFLVQADTQGGTDWPTCQVQITGHPGPDWLIDGYLLGVNHRITPTRHEATVYFGTLSPTVTPTTAFPFTPEED